MISGVKSTDPGEQLKCDISRTRKNGDTKMLRLKFTHEKVGLGLISLGLEENKVSKISGVKFTPGEAGPRRFVISEISIH